MGKVRGVEKQGIQEPVVRPALRMTGREFRVAVGRGIFRRVVLTSDWTHFSVRGEMEGGVDGVWWLSKEDGPRKFLNPAAALAELRKMGVRRVEVVMGEWDVELATLSMRQRPDVTARRLRRARMTTGEQLLEMAKSYPEMAALVPPGTQEPGPVSRDEEKWRLVDGKFEVLARQAQAEDAQRRAEWKAAEASVKRMSREESDALHDEVMREARASLQARGGAGQGARGGRS